MSKRVAAVVGTAVALVAAVPATATAGAGAASAGPPVGATSLSWSAVLVDGSGVAQTGRPLTAGWAVIGDRAPRFGSVRNTGTAALTGQTYTASVNGLLASPVRVDACVGAAWNTTANTCAGTVTTLVTSAAGTGSPATALAVGGQLGIRISLTGALSGTTNATVGVSVANGAHVRAATTTNS
ncbi:hypothetical protein [Umezawaea sp.]|uniref:hypothetical protein n=1 Tax=Umezawaea sp. TaxID=1955258 RepID=UPI002ED4C3A7